MSSSTKWFIGIVVAVFIVIGIVVYRSKKPAVKGPLAALPSGATDEQKAAAKKEAVDQVAQIKQPAGLNVSLILTKGTNAPEVQQLQHMLNILGYNLTEDGKFGTGTAKAVAAATNGQTGITLQQATAWAADGTLQHAPTDQPLLSQTLGITPFGTT